MTNKPERTPLPWEQQPDESADAWAAFQRYRDLPTAERSLSRLASEIAGDSVGKVGRRERKPDTVKSLVERWSSVHYWQERCRAYDREIDRQARDRHIDEVVAMRRRHAQQMEALLAAGMRPVVELMERIKEQSLVLADIPSGELFKLTIAFARVAPAILQAERQARGEPHDAPTEQATPVVASDYSMTDENLMEFWAVMEDMGVAPHPPEQVSE